MAAPYAELQLDSAFSFLRGASLAEELVGTAAELGLSAIGIADRNTVAGVVRMHEAAKRFKLRLLPGARLELRDGTPDLVCYPTDRAAWGRLCQLLTLGKRRARKVECLLDLADVEAHGAGQIVLAIPPPRLDAGFAATLDRLRAT